MNRGSGIGGGCATCVTASPRAWCGTGWAGSNGTADRRGDSCHDGGVTPEQVLARLSSLRQYTQDGMRYPHKPLLALLLAGSPTAARMTWTTA